MTGKTKASTGRSSTWWPDSLAEVARRARAGQQPFDPAVREFLDHFYSTPKARQAAIQDRPEPVGTVQDAYLAAVAEHLALAYGLDVPAWTEEPGRSLKRPFFAGGLESLKATLLVESPTAFRRRMIFISANALSRPRQTID
ncbi:MAG: hypothetical protein ACFCUQ_18525 [Kiloniellales bacterium]